MIDESVLPPAFRRGLDALRARTCPEASVTAIDANFAIIDLGVGELPLAFVESSARVFVRTPVDFMNALPYGVITQPYLRRKDGAAIPHQHLGHANARLLENPNTTGFWSWDWKAMPKQKPEDMAMLREWAWKCIRDGAQ